MGLFWDLIQHSQIRDAQDRAGSLEDRVARLEQELADTNRTLLTLLQRLEQKIGEDLDGDGRIG